MLNQYSMKQQAHLKQEPDKWVVMFGVEVIQATARNPIYLLDCIGGPIVKATAKQQSMPVLRPRAD